MTLLVACFTFLWFISGLCGLHLSILEQRRWLADSPEDCWIAVFGPFLLACIVVVLVSKGIRASGKGE